MSATVDSEEQALKWARAQVQAYRLKDEVTERMRLCASVGSRREAV